ncbi:MAG: DUF1553 domain-containing protein, partial [Planctomycetales bacterium]|nr:DUF1553 domain-containing protein [Planctomycetales bacterium]
PEPVYDFTGASADDPEAGRRDYAALQKLLRKKSAWESPTTVYAGRFREPGPTYRLFRGDPMAPREQVAPGTVTALGSLQLDAAASEQQRRVALADWIASPQNPLTARVIVNRIWQFHFGRGLVATPSDFGVAGMPPTHPDLLDWLANQLMQNNWSLKHIHRLILMSSTYRQSSRPSPASLEI